MLRKGTLIMLLEFSVTNFFSFKEKTTFSMLASFDNCLENNFGIIRDVNTLEWLDVAPIFDNGQSLNIDYYDIEEMHISGEGKLFYEFKPFDEIIKVVKDIKRIDIDKLNDLPEWFDNLLHKYQYITGYSDIRINILCILINRQIEKLKENIKNG